MTSPKQSKEYLTSKQACALLGVKPATLYTYVSRGLIHCLVQKGRSRLYSAHDVDRVATRSAARRGHAAVAASALKFGEPVLESSLTRVGEQGFCYRGRSVLALVEQSTRFEDVVHLLWGVENESWTAEPLSLGVGEQDLGGNALARMIRALPVLVEQHESLGDTARTHASIGLDSRDHGAVVDTIESLELRRARGLIDLFSALIAPCYNVTSGTTSQRLAVGFGLPRSASHWFDRALVLCADHELNASAFAARVAASADADLFACVGAALYVFSGAKHGTSCDRIEQMLSLLRTRDVKSYVKSKLGGPEPLLGFGHPLYPQGDPRAKPLLEAALAIEPAHPTNLLVNKLIDEVDSQCGLLPMVDLGLVTLAMVLGLPSGSATALFALGRTAGWIAHSLEQRVSPNLLRPRARYVGP